MRLMQEELRVLNELTRFGAMPGGIMAQLTMRINDEVDKGPIAAIREQYALKSAVEKDIMKV